MTEKEQIAAEIHHLITGCVSNYTPENQHAHKLLQRVLDFINKMPENGELERVIQEIVDLTKEDAYICDRMHETHHGSEWCRLNCGDRTAPDFVCCKEWLFNHWKK